MEWDVYTIGMVVVFVLGYFLITIEHLTKINKTTIALLAAIACWVLQFMHLNCKESSSFECFGDHMSNISQIVFFLLGALTIVEIVSVHKGFKIISDYIEVSSKKKLLWILSFITFFLSSILDNLTTTIVMVTLLRKLMHSGEDRKLIGGALVIAANAGGAWTPIGDVTTTMLWIGGQLSTQAMMKDLFLPSMACMLVALVPITWMLKGNIDLVKGDKEQIEPSGKLIFFSAIGLLIFVPIFKVITGLPPFMGVLFGLAMLWLITDLLHSDYNDREHLKMTHALSRIDLSSTLFFLAILLCIDALDSAKILDSLARWLDSTIGNTSIIATSIGLASAVVDNVPLVAAAMGMYDLTQYPTDSHFWDLVAFCAGTGGSILIIGSAAGVVFMGIEKVHFFWYVRRISLPALIGYFAGIGVYLLIFNL